MIAQVAPCEVCGERTPYDWERCGNCGAPRLLDAEGGYAGHRPLATLGRRLFATLVDAVLIGLPIGLALLLPDRIAAPGGQADEELASVLLLAALIYPTVALGARGRTLGKRLAGIHVVAADGGALTYPRAAVREGFGKVLELGLVAISIALLRRLHRDGEDALALYALALAPFGLVVASTAGIAFDERRQAMHDKAARTVVVRGAPAVSGTTAPATAPAAGGGAPGPAA